MALNSELMLFQPPVVNEGIEYQQWIECRPVNQITEDGSIDIHVKASGSQYLDLQRSRLYVKAKIVKEDGGNLVTADVVTPVNLWLQSLWNQMDVFLQQKLVSSSGTNYAYKALMDVLLNYGVDAELSQLQTQLIYRDSGGSMDHTNPTTTPINQGLIKRNLLAKNSATIDMVGPIYADVFQMPRYLLNEVDVHVRLFQNKNSFRLMSSVATLLSRTRESLCGFGHVQNFVRSGKSVVQLLKMRCFNIIILVFSSAFARSSCSSVFEGCSCISCWALYELLQYFSPNMIVGNIVKVGG